MKLAVGKGERVRRVLVVMRERQVSLRDVEAEDAEHHSADELLLERALLLVGQLVLALSSEQGVLLLVELFLDLTAEHDALSPN